MKATKPGWFDANRQRQLAAVCGLIYGEPHSRNVLGSTFKVPLLEGTCRGKVAWARHVLLTKGWPKECLEFFALDLGTEARKERGELPTHRHAVLVVALTLSDGHEVRTAVDNRYAVPVRVADLGYVDWVSVPV